MLGGVISRFLPPVAAGPADHEADGLGGRAGRGIPRLPEPLQEPGHPGQRGAGLRRGPGRLGLDDLAGQAGLLVPGLGQGAQRRRVRAGLACVPGVLAADAPGQRRPERDDPGGVGGEQDSGGVGTGLPGELVAAAQVRGDPLGDGGQVDMRGRDQALGRRRWPPAGIFLAGGQGDELVQHGRQVRGPQVRLQHDQQAARRGGPVLAQDRGRGAERPARRAPPGPDQRLQGLHSGRVTGVRGQLEQAADQDGAEQLRRPPGGIGHLPGSAILLAGKRPGPGFSPVDAVQRHGEIADDMALPSHELAAPLAALLMPPGPVGGRVLRRLLPGRLLRRPPDHLGGQGGPPAAGGLMRAADAVVLVELDG